MKKTLITLAALAMASVAQADILTENLVYADWNLAPKTEHLDSTFSVDKAFTFTMAIDWDAAVASGDGKTVIYTDGSHQNWFSNEVRLSISGTDITAQVWVNENGTMQNKGSATFSNADFLVDTYLKLSYSFDGAQTFTLSALKNDADATIVSTEITGSENWSGNTNLPGFDDVIVGKNRDSVWTSAFNGVEHLLVFNKELNEAELKTASLHIPEPTTATLSLLALAGLAARRRRK